MEEVNYNNITDEQIEAILEERERRKKNDWTNKLEKDSKTGKNLKTVDNILLFLENDPKYKDRLMFNELTRLPEYDGQIMSDGMGSTVVNDVQRALGFFSSQMVNSAVSEYLETHKYNPIRDYISGLEWDGKKRIENLFIKLLEADDTPLVKSMTRKWMIAAVKRIFEPGCKFDNMIVLRGGQGIGKSTICEKLSKDHYSSISFSEIGSKDIISKLDSIWIGMFDELSNLERKDAEEVKTFLSERKGIVREAYGHHHEPHYRHCVFIGSTNSETFLRDSSGMLERRYWVIKCNKTAMDNKVGKVMTEEFVNQLWAEAYHYYRQNPNQYLDLDEEELKVYAEEQKQYKTFNTDDALIFLQEKLNDRYPINEFGEVVDIEQLNGAGDWGYMINRIKGTVVTQLLKQEFREYRKRISIQQALDDEWTYGPVRFSNGKLIRAYVRKNPVKNVENNEKNALNSSKNIENLFKIPGKNGCF